jgi:hypothetical protein
VLALFQYVFFSLKEFRGRRNGILRRKSDLNINHKYKKMENLFAYGSLEEVQQNCFWTNTKRSSRKIIRIRSKRIEIEEEFGLEIQLSLLPKMIQTALKE